MTAQIIPIVELKSYDDFEVGEEVLVLTDTLSHPNAYKWYRVKIKEKYTHHAMVIFDNGLRECFKYFDMRKVY